MTSNTTDWGKRPLVEFAEFKNGINFTKDQKGDVGIPTVDVRNMYGNGVSVGIKNLYRVNKDVRSNMLLKTGDILFVRSSLKREGIGWASLFDGFPEPITFCGFIIRARLKSNASYDPLFLTFYFRSDAARERLIAGSGKVSITNISQYILSQMVVPMPSLVEQKKIVAILSTVQRAIELQERLIELTAELKKGLMHKLFTEGAHGEAQKETETGLVPESWETVALGNVCTVQTGIAKGRKIDPDDAVTLPYLRVANVQDGYLDLTEMKEITLKRSEIQRFSLKEGDVVLTEGGDPDKLGRGCIWHGRIERCVHQNHVFAVRPDTSKLSSEFLACQVQSPYGKSYFLSVAHKTTNLACINTTKLKGFPLLLPSKEEQKEVVDIIAVLDKKLALYHHRLKLHKDIFRTLLHKLMTAQIRVNDIDLSGIV